MAEYGIYYKCRLCGKTYTNTCGGLKPCRDGVQHTIKPLVPWPHSIGLPPTLLDMHCCGNERYGVADLIGCKPTQQATNTEG